MTLPLTSQQLDDLRHDMHAMACTTWTDVATSRHRSRKENIRVQKERKFNDDIFDVFTSRTFATQEEAVNSIAAIVLPFILRWVFKSAVERIVIWLWNRTHGKQGQ